MAHTQKQTQTQISRDPSSGVIHSLEAKLSLSPTRTTRTHPKSPGWPSLTTPLPRPLCVIFDHLITKGVLKPEDDFKDFVNYNSKVRQHT